MTKVFRISFIAVFRRRAAGTGVLSPGRRAAGQFLESTRFRGGLAASTE